MRVGQVQVAQDQEERDDDQDQREHLADEDVREPEARDPASRARQHVRGGQADERRQDRGDHGDLEAVQPGMDEVGVPQRRGVVAERRVLWDERGMQLDELARILEARREEPEQRDGEKDHVPAEGEVLTRLDEPRAARGDQRNASFSRPNM